MIGVSFADPEVWRAVVAAASRLSVQGRLRRMTAEMHDHRLPSEDRPDGRVVPLGHCVVGMPVALPSSGCLSGS